MTVTCSRPRVLQHVRGIKSTGAVLDDHRSFDSMATRVQTTQPGAQFCDVRCS
jgi:hypothetical protein